MKDLRWYLKTLFCKHDFRFIKGYRKSGDNILKVYSCTKCGKRKSKNGVFL